MSRAVLFFGRLFQMLQVAFRSWYAASLVFKPEVFWSASALLLLVRCGDSGEANLDPESGSSESPSDQPLSGEPTGASSVDGPDEPGDDPVIGGLGGTGSGGTGSGGTGSGAQGPGPGAGAAPAEDPVGGSGNGGDSSNLPEDAGASGANGMDDEPEAPSCSEDVLRTGPPAGKELFQAAAADETFPFSVHWIGTLDDPRWISMTSLTDIDNDGDLDFASGQRSTNGGAGVMYWWEYCAADHWALHSVGAGHNSVAGGNAIDADEDGWVDLLAGDSWYRNPQNPRDSEWERFFIGGPEAEELVVGELTGAAPPEVLYVWRPINPQWWTPDTDPTQSWIPTELSTNPAQRQQQGGAIGDLDGDGDNDVLVGYRFWYENVNGDGSAWQLVEIFDDRFDSPFNEPLAYIGDLDSDGDNDFAVASHFGGAVAWAENEDGIGTQFAFHELDDDMEFLHAIVIADFDNDADLDIFVGQNVGSSYIFENTDGLGAFARRQIALDVRMHEARVGDVDCDGDLDIAGKPWGDPSEGGEANLVELRDHVYLQNLTVDRGGPPRFDRDPYEEQHAIVQQRVCP